jgi:hypothetical protein
VTKTAGFTFVLAGAVAGVVCTAILYLVISGLGQLIAGESAEGPSLIQRAASFAVTFGLLTAGHWSLGIARRRFADDRGAMLVAKILTIAFVVIGLVVAATGGRWQEMIASLQGGIALLLVAAWLVMTHYGSKALERQTPAGNPAGAR